MAAATGHHVRYSDPGVLWVPHSWSRCYPPVPGDSQVTFLLEISDLESQHVLTEFEERSENA